MKGWIWLQKPDGPSGSIEAAVYPKWLNAANAFTVLRVVLAPFIILLLLYKGDMPWGVSNTLVAGLLFVAAALTDKADGYYARKNDAVTRVGQFLDPLADKLLMLPVMCTLWYIGYTNHTVLLPLWVLLVVFAREALISGIRIVGASKGIAFPATWSGKIKMFSQIIVVSILIFFPSSATELWVRILVFLMGAITVYSGIDYVLRARKEIFNAPARKPERPLEDPDEEAATR